MARAAERWFGKASYPLVAIAPNNYVCLFAGASGMSLPVFFALNVGGTVVRLVLLWYASDVVEAPLDWLRELITENRLPVLVLSVVVVGISLWLDQRAGGTEVGGLLHIDEEIAEEEGEEQGRGATADRDEA
jgi:membrane protein DedA with SNARE-associated domain